MYLLIAVFHGAAMLAPGCFHNLRLASGLRPKLCVSGGRAGPGAFSGQLLPDLCGFACCFDGYVSVLIAVFHGAAMLAPGHFHYLRLVPGLRPKLCVSGDG